MKTWLRAAIVVIGACAIGPVAGVGHDGAASEIRPLNVCPPGAPAPDCDFSSLAAAVAAAPPGATIVLRPGIYREAAILRADGVTLRAQPGAHVTGAAADDKAALVVKGDDTVIEGLECSRIWVRDGNGACVRAEGVNLTLRRVYFHDGQSGILGGRGRILIEDSTFERLGGDEKIALGRAHAIYIGRKADELILRRSRIVSSKEEGHGVKSRARRTVIENNVIASLEGRDSRLIDVPNGGDVVIRGNLLEKGPNSSNPDFVGVGLERGRDPAMDPVVNSTVIEGNTFIVDGFEGARMFRVRNVPRPSVSNNTFVGGTPYRRGGNRWFRDRTAADLPPYPALPRWPGR
ncbi:MAG: hypothetical protein ACE5GS_09200 [Kiloniellaceae bacterium]